METNEDYKIIVYERYLRKWLAAKGVDLENRKEPYVLSSEELQAFNEEWRTDYADPARQKELKIEYYKANRAKIRSHYATNRVAILKRAREHNASIKREVFEHYTGSIPHCMCCGEEHFKHLTIDHIGGGGRKHLHGDQLYAWLRKHYYPPGFRLLCFNCNMAIGIFGTCGHQDGGTSDLDMVEWHPFNPAMKFVTTPAGEPVD